MSFEWKDEYSVNVKEIDDQHKQLVALISRLNDAIVAMKTREELGGILHELAKYANYHFDTEEGYFKKFNYEGAEEHVAEHNKFKEKVKSLIANYEGRELELSFDLIDFLEDWLISHLMEIDRKYIKCFNDNGLR